MTAPAPAAAELPADHPALVAYREEGDRVLAILRALRVTEPDLAPMAATLATAIDDYQHAAFHYGAVWAVRVVRQGLIAVPAPQTTWCGFTPPVRRSGAAAGMPGNVAGFAPAGRRPPGDPAYEHVTREP